MSENKNEERETAKANEKIATYIGQIYRACRLRSDLRNCDQSVAEPHGTYAEDAKMVYLVERCLLECSKNTQLIIRKDFLEVPEKNWYVSYFSRSTYYRLKEKAVNEFVQCLKM